jgi:hypothetical protein
VPDDRDRIAATYSPKGIALFRVYRERIAKLIADGHITEAEGAILRAVRMQGIMLEGGAEQPIRRPLCATCKKPAVVIGKAQTFRCECIPGVEQSVADQVRKP